MKQKEPKSTLLAENTRGMTTTKQVAFAAPHPITPAYVKLKIYEYLAEGVHIITFIRDITIV